MKQTMTCCLMILVAAATSGMDCQGGDDAMMPGDDTMMPAAPTGEALFTLITQPTPFSQWDPFPDRQGTQASALPHGPMSNVFINDTVASALSNFTGQLPDGSIIVKENVGTDPSVTEAKLTVMWKVSGFDPDNNDWFWANMSPTGQINAEGKIQGCTGCHGAQKANDFVFVQQL